MQTKQNKNAKKISFEGQNAFTARDNYDKFVNCILQLASKCRKLKHVEFTYRYFTLYNDDDFKSQMTNLLKKLKMITKITVNFCKTGKQLEYTQIKIYIHNLFIKRQT